MINDYKMEFDVCPRSHKRNESQLDCTAVESTSHIEFSAVTGQLKKYEQTCNMLQRNLNYMGMLYESCGPTNDNGTFSPRSIRVKSPTNFQNHATNGIIKRSARTEIPNAPENEEIKKNPEVQGEKLSDTLNLHNLNKKSLHQILSMSNNNLSDNPTKSDALELLPKEPEVILKLTDRSVPVHNKVHSQLLYSASQGDKSDLLRRDEQPLRVIRKKRRKLKRSSSKSTTASKHGAVLPEIKHTRKIWKRRVHKVDESSIVNDPVNDKKKSINKNDEEVVEIYHNTAVQSVQSFSESSSKQCLKIPAQVSNNNIKNFDNQSKNQNLMIKQEFNTNVSNSEKKMENSEIIIRRKPVVKMKDSYGDGETGMTNTWCNNGFSLPNYQQPTCASKLKRAHRCYFSASFNLRNIPFVVGTSTTPSHNIGLNIQQVLSLMKTKQPGLATEMRPFFIKKIGKGLNPMMDVVDSAPQPTVEKSEPEANLKVVDEGEHKLEHKFPKSSSGITSNSAEIRNVMIRLHYQFEKMQTKYEKLQEQARKSNDEKLLETVRELEEELNAKESEIGAVVGLYNEVMALKSQINRSHDKKNSLVCIAQDYTENIPLRMQPMNTISYQRHRMPTCGIRTPSTSTRLTGLLRQIQSFQHQLISS